MVFDHTVLINKYTMFIQVTDEQALLKGWQKRVFFLEFDCLFLGQVFCLNDLNTETLYVWILNSDGFMLGKVLNRLGVVHNAEYSVLQFVNSSFKDGSLS